MDRFTPIAVVATLLMDVSLNSLLEPVSAHISVVILLTCLQVALPMCALVFLFVMFMRTKLLQAGNFGALLYKFRSLFMVAPIYLSFLIAIRAMRIEAYARNRTFALLWDIPGYYELFIGYRIVAVFFYFFLLRTLMRLGDPYLYIQRVAPEIDLVPDFCNSVSEGQFRAVPQIIRGGATLECINRGVALLNQITADKYQLLSLDARELHALDTSEQALAQRKRWELQRKQQDIGQVDCFSDQDLQMYRDLDSNQWRDVIQVLSHMNHIVPVKSTRHLTLYANHRRAADVQQWAALSAERIRVKLRQQPYRNTHIEAGPGSVAAGLRGALAEGRSVKFRN